MKTLHDNDAGYVAFYRDVLLEIDKARPKYSIFVDCTSTYIIDKFEFWVEEAFYDPELDDDILAIDTAQKILTVFESSECNIPC